MALAETDITGLDILHLPSEFVCATQIVEFISYNELDLARLVEEILIAQGYRTQAAPFGGAGSVYILADGGFGPLGFPLPRIAVLVMSINGVSDPDINELEAFLVLSGAANGLFVAWSNFSEQAKREARRLFHHAEFWDVTHIMDALKANYDKMPNELKSYLPLKRIWILDRRSDAELQ